MTTIVPQAHETTLRPIGDLPAAMAPVARRFRRANNIFMRQVNMFGQKAGTVAGILPTGVFHVLERLIADNLISIYNAAAKTRAPRFVAPLDHAINTTMIAASGGAGGAGGGMATIAELPVTIGIIFRSMQRIARQYGRDPDDDTTRQICLAIFLTGDVILRETEDSYELIGIRMLLQEKLQSFITRMVPNLLMKLSPKLASPPVIGAATGSVINIIYVRYHEVLVHVYFQLADLASEFGPEAAIAEFLRQTDTHRSGLNRK